MNLLCAQGLGNEEIDVLKELKRLDEWAVGVNAYIAGRLGHYDRDPARFDHSRAKAVMVYLVHGLCDEYEMSYDMKTMMDPNYSNPEQVFITGLLGSERRGSCASIPILCTAIARRLGLPIRLMQTPAHFVMRWDDPITGEVFNIETNGMGVDFFADSHYMEYPYHTTELDVKRGYCLTVLAPQQELACFLRIRGHVLQARDRSSEAMIVHAHSYHLWPEHSGQLLDLGMLVDREFRKISALDRAIVGKNVRYYSFSCVHPGDAPADWCWPPLTNTELQQAFKRQKAAQEKLRQQNPEYDKFLKELKQ